MTDPSPDSVRSLVDDLEGDVNNGGFHQFFFNSAGDRTRQILEALKAIGALQTLAIVEKACAKFPGGMPPAEWFERQEVLLTIAPECDEFEMEDAEFYEYKDDLAALVEAYCRR
jgi:hypothetical protein